MTSATPERPVRLSRAAMAVVSYALGVGNQKHVLAKYQVSYSEYRHARDQLTADGLLSPKGETTPETIGLIPSEELLAIIQSLDEKTRRLREEASARWSENSDLRREIEDLKSQLGTLEKAAKQWQAVNDLLEKLSPLKVGLHWLRAVAALIAIEAAIKQKLEEWKIPLQGQPSFGLLLSQFEQSLQQKEGRGLRPRLLGLDALKDSRNKIVHWSHQYVDLGKDDADSIVNTAADVINEIMSKH